jgi:hypothetical protein
MINGAGTRCENEVQLQHFVMRWFTRTLLIQSVFIILCLGLLEERFIAFDPSPGAVAIHNSPILYSGDDFVGVRIAAESLAADLTAVTGTETVLLDITKAQFRNASHFSSTIIVGSINSTVIRNLAKNGTNATFGFAELSGKWETFKTQVVKNPLPGIESALVISGSDKRGAIFGIHTLAEQCGQSP